MTSINIVHNVQLQQEYLEMGDNPIIFWLPLYHDLGIISGVFGGYKITSLHNFFPAMVSGNFLVLSSPIEFMKDPCSWLTNLTRWSKGKAFTAAPNFAYELVSTKVLLLLANC